MTIQEVETTVIDRQITEALATFSPTDAGIAELASKAEGLQIEGLDDAEGYKAVHAVRMEVKGVRVQVEKKRKELKADALKYGRAVDAEAKRITAGLLAIEEPLHEQQKVIDDEKAAIKYAAENAARLEAEAAEAARLEAEAAERAAEDARLAEERAALEAEQAKMRAEREALEEEKRKVEEAKRIEAAKAQAVEQERERAEQEKRAAELAAEREAELAAKREVEAAELKAKQDAARPDAEKVRAFAEKVSDLSPPDLSDGDLDNRVVRLVDRLYDELADLADSLDGGANS